MPLFGKKKNMTNADYLMKYVQPDPQNRAFLESMLEAEEFPETGRERELIIRGLYLVLLKFLEDRLLECMPTREDRQQLSQMFYQTGIGAIPKFTKFLERALPDYQLIYQQAYIDFAMGAFQDYELRNDGAYKLPGR